MRMDANDVLNIVESNVADCLIGCKYDNGCF